MKFFAVAAPVGALLIMTACSQSPQRMLESANKYHDRKQYKEASILYRKAINKDKTFAEAYYREGLNLLDQNNAGEAAKFLRRAVDLRPDNTDAEAKLAEIYLAAYASNPAKTRAILPDTKDLVGKILHKDAHSFDGLRLQGMLDLADKDTPKALQNFEEANRLKPFSRLVVGWYAQTLLAAGKGDQADQLMRDMIAHDKSWPPAYDFLYVRQARANDPDKAEGILHERVQNDPSSPVAITNLANFELARGKYADAEATMRQVTSDKQKFPGGREMMGDFYFRAKKYDQALEQYQAGVKENPAQSLHYQQRLVGAYLGLNKRDDALKLAKDLAAKNPKDTTSNQLYASLLVDTTTPATVKTVVPELQKIVQNNANDAFVHFELARAYLADNKANESLTEAQEAVRLKADLLPARLIIARIIEAKGEHAKVLEQTEMVLNSQPQNPEARLLRDRAYVGMGQPTRAQADLEALVQQYPKSNDAHVELGNLYLVGGQQAKASEQFELAWKSDPPDLRGFLGIQNIKMQQGKSDEAIAALSDLVQKNPGRVDFRFNLANFESTAGIQKARADMNAAKSLFAKAADNYKEIVKTNPKLTEAWIRLGVMQRYVGQTDAALGSFEQASNTNPSSTEALMNRAMLLEKLGKKPDAGDLYKRVLDLDPENSMALNNLAFLDAESGRNLDQAMTMAEKAKKRVPNNTDVSDTLGYVYYQKNLNSEALRIFKQVVEEQPQNATFRLHLAMALLKQGDKQGARDEAQKALKTSSAPDEQDKIKTFVGQIG